MGPALRVQRQKRLLYLTIDPRFLAILCGLGAFLDHLCKPLIAGHAKPVLPNGLCQRL